MINVLQHNNSLASVFLAELRDVTIQSDSMRFRKNLERIGEILAYEISKTLEYKPLEVASPLGMAKASVLKQQPVLCTILRAGLPFHQGVLNFFDRAENGFVSAYRRPAKNSSLEIQLDYISSPDLTDKTLIMIDTMLSTGQSIDVALKNLRKLYGEPAKIHIASVIASTIGLEYLQKNLPAGTSIWTVAVDEELTAQSYIVPGMGDAGNLAFGEKD